MSLVMDVSIFFLFDSNMWLSYSTIYDSTSLDLIDESSSSHKTAFLGVVAEQKGEPSLTRETEKFPQINVGKGNHTICKYNVISHIKDKVN